MQTTVTLSPTVTIRSDSFDPAHIEQSVLCLELGPDRFRVMVQDESSQAVYLEDYAIPALLSNQPLISLLPNLFRNHAVLSAGPWPEIRIGVNSPSFTLVPKPLFRKEYAGSYLALMRGSELPAHEFAQAYDHKDAGFLTVFNLEHAIADYFSGVYPLQPLTYVHQVSALLQAVSALNRQSLTPDTVYLYFDEALLTIIHYRGQQLQYCNRFDYKNSQDMTYYLLYILNEQQLKPEAVSILMYGEITPFAETYSELSRFLPNLTFGQLPPGFNLATAFNNVPVHRYLSLYGLGLMGE